MVEDPNKAVKPFQQEERSGPTHPAEINCAKDTSRPGAASKDGSGAVAQTVTDSRQIARTLPAATVRTGSQWPRNLRSGKFDRAEPKVLKFQPLF